MLNFKQIKTFFKYATKPAYLTEGLRNPRKVIKFLKKDLIIEPPEFIADLLKRDIPTIDGYIQEINEKREFNDHVWQGYSDFQKQLIKEKRKPKAAGGTTKGAGITLYTMTRLLKPDIVLETGVANGISSAYVLCALAENKKGKLISIDLPYEINKDYPPDYVSGEGGKALIPEGGEPGWLIPEDLKERWRLILGSSSERLPLVLKESQSIDIFIHDSDHTYENMLWEFRTVWPFVRKGGILISHDVIWNTAFDDFCRGIESKGSKYREEFGAIIKE